MTKSKLVYCYFGNGIALGMYGAKSDIEREFNQLYNYGAHNDEIEWLSDTFGYVLTTKEKLIRGTVTQLMALDIEFIGGLKRGRERKSYLESLRQANTATAEQCVEQIPLENFLAFHLNRGKEYGFLLAQNENLDSLIS